MKVNARSLIAVGLLAATLVGCTSETKYGKCVGVTEDHDRNPSLVYETSATNVILAFVFGETIIVPAIVVLDETYCPVAKRELTP